MKFISRQLQENVNISATSPIRELFSLLGWILGSILLFYIALGLALDILIDRMPDRLEQAAAGLINRVYQLQGPLSNTELQVQQLLDGLIKVAPQDERSFTVRIMDSSEVNALALPGGRILIYTGLLEEIESENELTMVLAHELGHFVSHDHLRALGRGLVLTFICGVIFGADSSFANFTQNVLVTADLKFSREQEVAADIYALELLSKKYGHVAGACDFFERVRGKKYLPRFCKFLSTHPDPADRISLLQAKIREEGYQMGEKIPLDLDLQDFQENQ